MRPTATDIVCTDDLLSLRVPLIPRSAKNSQRIRRKRDGRRFITKGEAAESDFGQLRVALTEATGIMHGRGRTLFGGEDVELTVMVNEARRETTVTFRMHAAEHPIDRRASGTRDIHNVFDVIADAAQGIVYDNDRQLWRVVGEFGW